MQSGCVPIFCPRVRAKAVRQHCAHGLDIRLLYLVNSGDPRVDVSRAQRAESSPLLPLDPHIPPSPHPLDYATVITLLAGAIRVEACL